MTTKKKILISVIAFISMLVLVVGGFLLYRFVYEPAFSYNYQIATSYSPQGGFLSGEELSGITDVLEENNISYMFGTMKMTCNGEKTTVPSVGIHENDAVKASDLMKTAFADKLGADGEYSDYIWLTDGEKSKVMVCDELPTSSEIEEFYGHEIPALYE